MQLPTLVVQPLYVCLVVLMRLMWWAVGLVYGEMKSFEAWEASIAEQMLRHCVDRWRSDPALCFSVSLQKVTATDHSV